MIVVFTVHSKHCSKKKLVYIIVITVVFFRTVVFTVGFFEEITVVFTIMFLFYYL